MNVSSGAPVLCLHRSRNASRSTRGRVEAIGATRAITRSLIDALEPDRSSPSSCPGTADAFSRVSNRAPAHERRWRDRAAHSSHSSSAPAHPRVSPARGSSPAPSVRGPVQRPVLTTHRLHRGLTRPQRAGCFSNAPRPLSAFASSGSEASRRCSERRTSASAAPFNVKPVETTRGERPQRLLSSTPGPPSPLDPRTATGPNCSKKAPSVRAAPPTLPTLVMVNHDRQTGASGSELIDADSAW